MDSSLVIDVRFGGVGVVEAMSVGGGGGRERVVPHSGRDAKLNGIGTVRETSWYATLFRLLV